MRTTGALCVALGDLVAGGVDAVAVFSPASLDMVDVSVVHDEASMLELLDRWLPLLRPGGVLSGRGYVDGDAADAELGLRRAVDAFCARHDVSVHATSDERQPSWIVQKSTAA